MTIKDERTEAEAMWELIRVLDVRNKNLEERVIYLERKLDTSRDPNPPDGYYFDN